MNGMDKGDWWALVFIVVAGVVIAAFLYGTWNGNFAGGRY